MSLFKTSRLEWHARGTDGDDELVPECSRRDAVVYVAGVVLATLLLTPVVVAIIRRTKG